jgi:hypothetical protein
MTEQKIFSQGDVSEKTEIIRNNGRFVPGVSGNPEGRPKGTLSVTAAIKAKLLEIEPKNQKTWLEGLIMAIMNNAIVEKNPLTQKIIWEMIDGKAKQPLEHSGSIAIRPEIKEILELTDDELIERSREAGITTKFDNATGDFADKDNKSITE